MLELMQTYENWQERSNNLPLKVTVGSTKKKASILKGCTKLCNKNNLTHVQKIYITPDLTPKQQAETKALRAKLKELNKYEKLYWKKMEKLCNPKATGRKQSIVS